MSKIFISYKHNVEPDERLADYFVEQLTLQEHNVFIDKKIYLGDNWPAIIKQQIDSSDFFIVLLSDFSVRSEMIIQEVSIAYNRKKHYGLPTILPIRIGYTLPYAQMPYDLGAMLRSRQDAIWLKEGDEIEIVQKLNAVIERGRLLVQEISSQEQSVDPSEKASALACDGNAILPDHQEPPPLPAFDSRWLKELDMPGGAVRLESPFYVERHEDSEAKNQLLKNGVTIRIKGSRQIGKTSLLARLYQHASDNKHPIVYIDFQELDKDQLKDLDTLLRYLAYRIAIARDEQSYAKPDNYWQGPLGPKDKLTHFLSREILAPITQPLVLILDEVDRVFSSTAYRDDFFSLIRSWHNKRAIPGFEVWKKLNIVLTYSTEAFSFITDLNQSPFNVGMDFKLVDFNRTQVENLNRLHGEPVKTLQEMDDFMDLLQGHPFLVRKAFYILTCQSFTTESLMQRAYDEDGPFSDHLHSYLWRFHQNQELYQGMKAVLESHSCSNDLLFYQLRSSGLVYGSDRSNVLPRCGLYANYFRKHL